MALKINIDALTGWLEVAKMNESEFAKEIGVDVGNFSKMTRDLIPTSKVVIEKVLERTGLPVDSILIFDRNAEVKG